jgi:hypothetical protein
MLALIFSILPAWAQKSELKFKSIEVTHFSKAEGVELTSDFPDFLYACLLSNLKNNPKYSKMYEEVIGENEFVEPADAEQSLILQGTVLEYKRSGTGWSTVLAILGSLCVAHSEDRETRESCRVPDHALRARVVILRRANKESLFEREIKVAAHGKSEYSDRPEDVIAEERLAAALAQQVAGSVKKKLRP